MFGDRRSRGNPGTFTSCGIAGDNQHTYLMKHRYFRPRIKESRTFIRAVSLWSDNAALYSVSFGFGKGAWCVGKWKQQGGYFLFFELDFANAQRFVVGFEDRLKRFIIQHRPAYLGGDIIRLGARERKPVSKSFVTD
jgi:hypothetical protein